MDDVKQRELEQEIATLRPDLNLTIRGVLTGGLSGAKVLLVDIQLDGHRRLGVLKIVSASAAQAEAEGDAVARGSWLKAHLPEEFETLGTTSDGKKAYILQSLAKDNREACQTLRDALFESFGYAKDNVLFSLAWAYRQNAALQWPKAAPVSIESVVEAVFGAGLSADWLERWTKLGLPGSGTDALVFEGRPERWPNPVAFFVTPHLWAGRAEATINVPWTQAHGDLNANNVLCPTYVRATALGLIESRKNPSKTLKQLSLIDTPFSRELPFTYDLCYLLAWLHVLLPRFDSRSHKDTNIRAFEAILDQIDTQHPALNVPADADKYVTCGFKIIQQAFLSEVRMPEDIRAALLLSLALAALWQATKVAPKDRVSAVQQLCLSSLALKRLLGTASLRLAGPDFQLNAMSDGVAPPAAWSAATSELAQEVEGALTTNSLVLVLGDGWNQHQELPNDHETASELRKDPDALSRWLAQLSTKPQVGSAIGRLPLAAVFDLSLFEQSREAIGLGIPPPRLMRPVYRTESEPEWGARETVFYFHLRGSFHNRSSVSMTGPERSRSRRELRPLIEKFKKRRSGRLTVLYVGMNLSELREVNAYLQEIWAENLKTIFIGKTDADIDGYLEEWHCRRIDSSIADLLMVATDLVVPSGTSKVSSKERTLKVADLAKDKDGILVTKEGVTLEVEIPFADAEAIARAGMLLYEDRLALPRPAAREARQFFIGHRVELDDLLLDVPIEREQFPLYLKFIYGKLTDKYPQTVSIPSQPGAGGSTALMWLAKELATKSIPILILSTGGNPAFEAIERFYRLVSRSFVVMADPEDVPSDELTSIQSRCAPSRYPVLFITSTRVGPKATPQVPPVLRAELSDREIIDMVYKLGRYCVDVNLGELRKSNTKSMFLLTLEAFGGANIRVNTFVKSLCDTASPEQKELLAVVALFSHFAHRPSTLGFLEVLVGKGASEIEALLEVFEQALVLREGGAWSCRHPLLCKSILQYVLTGDFQPEAWRQVLAEFVTGVVRKFSSGVAGADIASEYVWALLNPQLEAERGPGGERPQFSRLIGGEEGIPYDAMRHNVFDACATAFPEHVNILSHYAKFLSEQERKYSEADIYLNRALELDGKNETIMHMLGKRYFDEVREVVNANPAVLRAAEVDSKISVLTGNAHFWFDRARSENIGSEYNYATALQLDAFLIRDEFKRFGVKSPAEKPEVLAQDRVAALLAHADAVVADGLRYIEPTEGSRRVFSLVRDQLHALRGDLNEAIKCYQHHVQKQRGRALGNAKVQLARFLVERADLSWQKGERGKADRDYQEGERQLYEVLQDPTYRYGNIKLWFDCARHMTHWTRSEFIDRLLQLYENDRTALDASFLLMCLYFCDALQTSSVESWRRYEEFRGVSAQRSGNLAVRRYIREWLVSVPTSRGPEFRVFPNHLFEPGGANVENSEVLGGQDPRAIAKGVVERADSSTAGYITIEPMGFRVFFQPRVKGREFYKSDEGRTRVRFLVNFTYEKPQAFDVQRDG